MYKSLTYNKIIAQYHTKTWSKLLSPFNLSRNATISAFLFVFLWINLYSLFPLVKFLSNFCALNFYVLPMLKLFIHLFYPLGLSYVMYVFIFVVGEFELVYWGVFTRISLPLALYIFWVGNTNFVRMCFRSLYFFHSHSAHWVFIRSFIINTFDWNTMLHVWCRHS